MTELVGQIAYDVTLETAKLVNAQRDVEKKIDTIGEYGTRLQTKFTAVAAGISAVLSAIAVEGVVSKLISVQRQFDVLFSSLRTVTGGVSQASAEWDRLVKFAAKTPYTLDQSVGAFVKLKTLGLDPSERAMTSFGNTAAAMGKDLMQMIEAVADASTGEFERLRAFGIKSKTEGDKIAFTFQGVTTRVKNTASDITDYLMKIGEVNFSGAMIRRMETLDGAISNLTDSWNELYLTVGRSGVGDLIAAAANKGTTALQGLSRLVKDMSSQGFASAVFGYNDLAKAAIKLNDAKSELDRTSGKGFSGFIFSTSATEARQIKEKASAQEAYNKALADFRRVKYESDMGRLMSAYVPRDYSKATAQDDGGKVKKTTKVKKNDDPKDRSKQIQSDADRFNSDQNTAIEYAAGIINEQKDPAEQIRIRFEARANALNEAYAQELLNEQTHSQAIIANQQSMNDALKKLEEDKARAKLAAESAMLQGGEKLFGSMADMAKHFAGEQSSTYKTMFAVSKAFAIADAIIKIQQGIAAASALPFPVNLGAMATVAASTASIVTTISGTNFGGGRQYGGPVTAGSMYRVNETGQPEMFTSANGQQYMLPTASGNVTAADKVGGGGVTVYEFRVINQFPAASVSQRTGPDGRPELIIAEVARQISENSGPVWSALRSSSNVQSRL